MHVKQLLLLLVLGQHLRVLQVTVETPITLRVNQSVRLRLLGARLPIGV